MDTNFASYGLTRTLGMVGFGAAGYLALWQAQTTLHMDLLGHNSIRDLSQQEIVVSAVVCAIALFGLAIGQAMGSSITVRSNAIANIFDTLWHYGANTIFTWVTVVTLLFGLTRGRGAAAAFRISHSTFDQVWLALGIPALLGLWLGLWSCLISGSASRFVAWVKVMVPFLSCWLVGRYESQQLGMSSACALVTAAMPIWLLPSTRYYIIRDQARRLAS